MSKKKPRPHIGRPRLNAELSNVRLVVLLTAEQMEQLERRCPPMKPGPFVRRMLVQAGVLDE